MRGFGPKTGSPLSVLHELVDRVVTVSSIGAGDLYRLRPQQPAGEAASLLRTLDYDVAGVADESVEPVARYVSRTDLETSHGTVAQAAQVIRAADTIASSSPLAVMIDALAVREFVFVLEHDRVRSIVTRADLQAPVIGVVTLGYLVTIETGVAPFVVRELGSCWFEQLSKERQCKVREIYEYKRSQNAETGLEDCLYFSDWLHLACRCPRLLADLGYTRSTFRKATARLPDLRNALAHGGTIIDHLDPPSAIACFRTIRSLAEGIWRLHAAHPVPDRHDA